MLSNSQPTNKPRVWSHVLSIRLISLFVCAVHTRGCNDHNLMTLSLLSTPKLQCAHTKHTLTTSTRAQSRGESAYSPAITFSDGRTTNVEQIRAWLKRFVLTHNHSIQTVRELRFDLHPIRNSKKKLKTWDL